MFNDKVMQEIEFVAKELGVEPAALAAVAHIESGLRTHAMVKGRAEPLIRFEGHYFDRRLKGTKRALARRAGLAAPEAGAIANPPTQAARWALLDCAAAIDRSAALESVSWGIGQVMGAHWAWLGYASVEALVEEARSGVRGQLRLVTRYIDRAGLTEKLRTRDWAAFARGYNGPAFGKNGYDRKLAVAYGRYAARASGATSDPLLRPGSRGKAVRMLQADLAARGYTLRIDGDFGEGTTRAVRDFQQRHALIIDGIVGPATREALRKTEGRGSLSGWMMGVLDRVYRERLHLTARRKRE